MTDTTKTNMKQNDKPTDVVYAIARFSADIRPEYVAELLPVLRTTPNVSDAMTWQSKIEASAAIRHMDDTWTIVRVG